MKLNKEFVVQELGDLLVAVSPEYKGVIRMSEPGAFIFEQLAQETTPEAILDALCQRYDAPRDVLSADMETLLSTLRQAALLDE